MRYLALITILATTLLLACTAKAATVELAWDPNPQGDGVVKYVVYQSTTLTGQFLPVGETAGTRVTVTGLVPGAYFFYVLGVNFWGNSGAPSTIVSTPAGLPSRTGGLTIRLVE
jgi:hypothetical protein